MLLFEISENLLSFSERLLANYLSKIDKLEFISFEFIVVIATISVIGGENLLCDNLSLTNSICRL